MACVIFGYKIKTDQGIKCALDIVSQTFYNEEDLAKLKSVAGTVGTVKEVKLKNGYSVLCPNGGASDSFFVLSYSYIKRNVEKNYMKIKQPHTDDILAFMNWSDKYVNTVYLTEMQYGVWLVVDAKKNKTDSPKDTEKSKEAGKPVNVVFSYTGDTIKKAITDVTQNDVVLINGQCLKVRQLVKNRAGKHGTSKIQVQYEEIETKNVTEVVYIGKPIVDVVVPK